MTITPRKSIVLAVVLAASMILTGCLKSELETGLSEAEAQEVIVMLKQHGLEAQRAYVARGKETPTWTVYVLGGNSNLVLAWRILQENGLPRQRVKGLDEVFSASGLIPTASEEKAKLLVGLTGEITRTLKSVDGVVDARVHVVLPDNSPLLDRSQWSPTTASVLIKYRGKSIPMDENEVKSLVARGVQGLTPEQVAVIYKNVPSMPREARDVAWYVGNQEVTVGAVGIMIFAALLAFGQSFQIRRLKHQIAAMRTEYARREAVPAAPRG
jgi:type III secretion protein J